ncbi:hypothetical protein [Neolewinella sp.]|uniref:hypothetical protein n=1 Tax=Neolewinella sp. TaxID=2993543 RepID=UPI003B521725
MSNYESHWRQALHDYTPAATDADWAAMRGQLLNGKPRGGGSLYWWIAILLLFIGAGTQVQWDRAAPPVLTEALPIATSPEAIRPTVSVQPLPIKAPITLFQPAGTEPASEQFDTPALSPPLAPAAPPPTYVLHRLDLLPVARLRPLRYRPLNRLEAIGKTLIVVPPEPESLPPVRVLRANGLYPPIRERKN